MSIDTISVKTISSKASSSKASSIEVMPDRELLKRLMRVADNERFLTANLLALLGECDTRRLYLGEGCSSLFTYCTQVLHFSEHAAYHRIEAARAARQFPIILEMVADGSVTLTTVALLRPHLTPDNHRKLLGAARHHTKREVEYQIACLAPKPDAQTAIRRLPASALYLTPAPAPALEAALAPPPTPASTSAPTHALAPALDAALALPPAPALAPAPALEAAVSPSLAAGPQHLLDESAPGATSIPALPGGETVAPDLLRDDLASTVPPHFTPKSSAEPRPQITPLAADRYLLRVTLSAETHATLRRAQQLMGHRLPGGDPHAIIGRALSLLVEHLERAKFARVRRPRLGSTGTSAPPSSSAPPSTSAPPSSSAPPRTSASPGSAASPGSSASPGSAAPPSSSASPGSAASPGSSASPGSAAPPSSSASPGSAASPGSSASPSTSAPPRTSAPAGTSVSASAGGSRHIPAAMRRHVWARDEGRCAFVGARGRCTETGRLEFHHVVAFARGGPTSVENLALRCRAHNAYESDQAFGVQVHRGNERASRAGLQETHLQPQQASDLA